MRRLAAAANSSHPREPEASGRELDDSLARLMFRLRRERLLGHERPRLYWAAAAVAATVVLGVSLSLMRPETEVPQPEESVSRGVSWPQELTDADPPALAVKLVDDLKALGISATRSAEGPTVIVSARIPNREDPVLAAVLARYRLKAPPDGTLDVRIRPAPR